MFAPTSEQADELREWLFGGDWQEPAPDWYADLAPESRTAAIIAAETHGTPWHYTTEERKRRAIEIPKATNFVNPMD